MHGHGEARRSAGRDREHLPLALHRAGERQRQSRRDPGRDGRPRAARRARGAALLGHRRPHLPRGAVLPCAPQERRADGHRGGQRPVLVERRREVLRVHAGPQDRRRRAEDRRAAQQGVRAGDRPQPLAAQHAVPGRLGGGGQLHRPAGGAQAEHRRRLAQRLRRLVDGGAAARLRPDRPAHDDPPGVHRLGRLRALHRGRRARAADPLRPQAPVLRALPHRRAGRGRAARAGDRRRAHAHERAGLRHGHRRVRGQGRRPVRHRLPQPGPGLRQLLDQGAQLRVGARPHERPRPGLRARRPHAAVEGRAPLVAPRGRGGGEARAGGV